MLLRIVTNFAKKPSLIDYRKRLTLGLKSLQLAIVLSLPLIFVQKQSFTRGFFVGITFAMAVISLFYQQLLKDEDRLKAHYIKRYDERYRDVERLSALTTLVIVMLLQLVLTLLFVLFEVVLPYQQLLYLLSGVTVICFILARAIWDKRL